MRSVSVFVSYVIPAVFLVWRAETYVDINGRSLILARLMCLVLALMISLVGLMRSMATFD